MVRLLTFAALAALFLGVAASHDLLFAAKPECTGKPPACEDGKRFSRKTCECVDKGKQKQLICHVGEEEVIDEETEEITLVRTATVISVSVESAHFREGKHGDCPAVDGAEKGDDCLDSCPELPAGT